MSTLPSLKSSLLQKTVVNFRLRKWRSIVRGSCQLRLGWWKGEKEGRAEKIRRKASTARQKIYASDQRGRRGL